MGLEYTNDNLIIYISQVDEGVNLYRGDGRKEFINISMQKFCAIIYKAEIDALCINRPEELKDV